MRSVRAIALVERHVLWRHGIVCGQLCLMILLLLHDFMYPFI